VSASPRADALAMWTRRLVLPALAALSLALTACSGVEGKRAQELLLQAQAAGSTVQSAAFEGSMSYSLAGETVRLEFEGAGSKAGQYFALRSAGGPGVPVDIRLVIRGNRAWLRTNGAWEQMPVPAELVPAARSASLGSAAFQQLAQHVEEVRVSEHQLVGGEPSAVIGGELDTAGLLESLGALSALSGELPAGLDLDSLGVELGDIHATLTVSERTHLLTSALVRLSLKAAGETVDIQLGYRLTAVNEAVRIPTPG
jgi:hypothetical protein